MQECDHFPFGTGGGGCSICIHGLSLDKAVKPDDWWLAPNVKSAADPGDVLLEGLMAGAVCPKCLTDRSPIGCSCSRDVVFAADMQRTASFLNVAPSFGIELGTAFSDEEARHVAMSVFKRASRRVDWESDEDRADARRGMAEELGAEAMKVKWFPPRVTEPTHLPV